MPGISNWPKGADNLTHDATLDDVVDVINAMQASSGSQPLTLDGVGKLPTPMATPPTLTAGIANAASAIASSVLVPPNEPNCYTYFGGVPKRGTAYPDYTAMEILTNYSVTSPGAWGVEFALDTVDATGRFEINVKGTSGKVRVLVWEAGQWKYATAAQSFTQTADGNGYLHLVTLGAAGIYRIRLEFEGTTIFFGIRTAPTDGLSGTSRRRSWAVIGDSFTEPTIVDSGSSMNGNGWATLFGHLTGWDTWCAGKGSTGYLNPGATVKFRDRLPEILAYSPYGIVWAGGINDSAYGGMTYASLVAEILACLDQAAAAGVPYARQILVSPFWRGDYTTPGQGGVLIVRDAVKDAAAARGCLFLDVLAPEPHPSDLPQYGTLQAAANAGATTISSSVKIPVDGNLIGTAFCVLIGNPGSPTLEMRKVTNVTGTGPYTLTVAALTTGHAAGEQIRQVSQPIWTGTGKQGATTGVGNSDRYVGNDGTHPTLAGHSYIARQVYRQLALKLAVV